MVSEHLGPDGLRWVEGRLSALDRKRVDAHLAECADCRAELAEWQETARALRALPNALEAMPVRVTPAWRAVQARLRPQTLNPHPVWRAALSVGLVMMIFAFSNTVASAGRVSAAPQPASVVSAPLADAFLSPAAALVATRLPFAARFASSQTPAYTHTPTPTPNPPGES
jgi:anti-sigma factor RsiW